MKCEVWTITTNTLKVGQYTNLGNILTERMNMVDIYTPAVNWHVWTETIWYSYNSTVDMYKNWPTKNGYKNRGGLITLVQREPVKIITQHGGKLNPDWPDMVTITWWTSLTWTNYNNYSSMVDKYKPTKLRKA